MTKNYDEDLGLSPDLVFGRSKGFIEVGSAKSRELDDRRKRAIFGPGVGYKPLEDPPKQIMKWTNYDTDKVYNSFDEYWIGKYGHKFEVHRD